MAASLTDVKPGAVEIEAQLRVLLAGQRLMKSPSQAAVLEVIVMKSLRNDKTDEKSVGRKAFPNYVAGRSSDVRINVFNLRKTLSDYYADEGADDSVIIEIRKGRNYGVHASYNPSAEVVGLYLGALRMMSDIDAYPWLVLDAIANCWEAMNLNPRFAPAYGLYAELVLCYGTIRHGDLAKHGVGPFGGKDREARVAQEYALRALKLDRKTWRARLALGISHACRQRWKLAKKHVDRALAIYPQGVRDDPWYSIYLMAVDRAEEALAIAKNKWLTTSPRSIWRALYLLFVYVAPAEGYATLLERYQLADMDFIGEDAYLLTAIRELDTMPNWQPCLLGRTRLSLETLRGNLVQGKYHRIASLGLLAMSRGIKGRPESAAQMAELLAKPKIWSKVGCDGEVAIVQMGRSRLASKYERQALLDERIRVDADVIEAWDAALAFIGAGEHERAIRYLNMAFDSGNPMTLWLHRWPFFRDLYCDPEFTKLIERRGRPAKAVSNSLKARGGSRGNDTSAA